MRVFNITDVPNRALEHQGLVNVSVKVGATVVGPGESVVLRGTAKERSDISSLLRRGAVVVDQLPPSYAAKKGLMLDGSKKPDLSKRK